MSRLLSSLTAAAAALADQAATRLDTWVENNTSTDAEAPREEPLGFAVPTGERGKGVNAMGLTGEQRARWLAEVKTRLDASTGGPWCTEERDNPTGRIISPYGAIATGVTREADRDLIENARADLYGLLALAEYDDQIIEALQGAARHQTERRNVAEHELQGMQHRERAVDMVAAAWADGSLKGYRYRVDDDTPAGRVIAAIEGITASRGKTIRDLQSQVEATHGELLGMNQREADVDHVLDAVVDGRLKLAEYVDPETPAGRVRDLVDTLLKQVREAEARADLAERKLDAHHRHDAATDAGTVRARAAAHITAAADIAEQAAAETDASDAADAAAADAFIAGLRAAADIIVDHTPQADPNVAHIDTVNGRAATADEQADDMPAVTPGSFIETVLATGGTVVIDDNGDPHVTDILIGEPRDTGTLITADGKRHRFTGAPASPVDGYVIENSDHDTALGIMRNIKEHREARDRADRDDEAIDG